MINIKNKTNCCGCGACANVCPRGAIIMQADDEGFLYPKINKDKCIECGLCERSCPILNIKSNKDDLKKAFIFRSGNDEALRNSTSGGFITPLADYLFNNGYMLIAATYDDRLHVVHKCYEDNSEISLVRGSKYVQSEIGNVFLITKNRLDSGKKVCFIGTPCQINGLIQYLGKDYENLLTVDLVCHGVGSPKVWDKYLDHMEKRYGSRPRYISFRNKTYGYYSSTMKICFDDGHIYYGSPRIDYFLNGYYDCIYLRPSCYECKFKTKERNSDITMFDCWHPKILNENIIDDDKGYTNLIVHSQKGMMIINELKITNNIYTSDYYKAISKDGIKFEHCANYNPKRREYFRDIDKMRFEDLSKKYLNIRYKDLLIEKFKVILFKIGIMQKIAKANRSK